MNLHISKTCSSAASVTAPRCSDELESYCLENELYAMDEENSSETLHDISDGTFANNFPTSNSPIIDSLLIMSETFNGDAIQRDFSLSFRTMFVT